MQDVGFGNLQDLPSPCKIYKYLQDASFSRKSKKMLQDPGYFAKINQEILSITCTIIKIIIIWQDKEENCLC
jgi:hypothetical protein